MAFTLKTAMYKSLDIQGFRQFNAVKIDNLSRINLILGPNNSGKTTLLEAVLSHACGLNERPFLDWILFGRSDKTIDSAYDYGEKIIQVFNKDGGFPPSFNITGNLQGTNRKYEFISRFTPSSYLADLDPVRMAKVATSSESYKESKLSDKSRLLGVWETLSENGGRKISVRFPPEDDLLYWEVFKSLYLQEVADYRYRDAAIKVFSHLKRSGVLEDFLKEMQQVFPEIRLIDMLPFPDGKQSSVYMQMADGQFLQISVFGDGMRRWYHLLGNFIVSPNSVHCIEEIDATFHPVAQAKLAQSLVHYSKKYNNQLFLTSHNIEFADTFLEALYGENGMLAETDDIVSVYTIVPPKDGQHQIRQFTGREAYDSRRRFNLELR